tara:strand:- start:3902 stop:4750 length:849 start_codon:yes stop_codon:yes gene_type:complete
MNIIIVTGRSRNIGNFYDNIINPIKGYFKDKNINFETIHFADQVRKDENPNNLYIGIFHHVDLHNMPKNYIMLAMDPPSNCNNTMKQKLKNANKILVYTDLEYFKKINENIIYYPFSYHKSIENMYNLDIKLIKKTRDLIMIGTINDKRTKLFNLLKINKYDIFCPNIEGYPRGIFEKEQDILLYSSKIVLLNNYYKNDIQYPRMIYNSANKIFFIYILNEDDDDNLLDNVWDNMFVKCKINNIFETIDYYLKNENERVKSVNMLYDYVKNTKYIDKYLKIY